jgi:NDP-sugar pyrophosphorylase family protein
MNILFLLAGESKSFEEQGYHYPKYLLEIDGKTLVQHVIEHVAVSRAARHIFVVRKEEVERFHFESVLKLLSPESEVVVAEGLTRGAACTALLAVEMIDNDQPLLIVNGDQIVDLPLDEALASFEEQGLDGGLVVFDSVHPRWSYVRLNEAGRVIEAAEKRPISRNATAGLYYFAKGAQFVAAAKEMIRKDASVGDAFYVCPAYNELLLNQGAVGVYRIGREQYHSLAQPQGVQAFEEKTRAGRGCP